MSMSSASAVATDTFTKPAAPARRRRPDENAPRIDDLPSGASIVNRGERPLELALLLMGGTRAGGVLSVRNRDRQPQLVRVLLLRRRIVSARDCLGVAAVALEPQRDGTIIAVDVPAFSAIDVRFRGARADERSDYEDSAAEAAAAMVKAARASRVA